MDGLLAQVEVLRLGQLLDVDDAPLQPAPVFLTPQTGYPSRPAAGDTVQAGVIFGRAQADRNG